MFKITGGRGYRTTFKNGWTLSVQWGLGNYCAARNNEPIGRDFEAKERAQGEKGSATVEIAAWKDQEEPWFNWGSDEVAGWVTPEQVADVTYFLSHDMPDEVRAAITTKDQRLTPPSL